ncbi:hypothetical protein HCC45_05025 [Streptococcus suis]|nr:hypothetical protein [Streptococcus suis]
MVAHEKEYALYKGDKLLAIGTAKELAERFGVKVSTIHFYKSPTYQANQQKEWEAGS